MMRWQPLALLVVTFLASVGLTRWLIRWAPKLKFIDVPNSRSSHVVPTPRGGGLAIVVSFVLAVGASSVAGWLPPREALALVLPSLAIAGVGLIDDRFGVPPAWRLLVHVGAAAAFLWILGGLPAIGFALVDDNRLVAAVLGALAIAWCVNFFNFMDGIDGIAAMETVFVASALSLLGMAAGLPVLALASGLTAAATAGFLLWNWPPARIFMGDVGSGFIGFLVAALSIIAIPAGRASIWVVLLLPALFLVDSTVTMLVRATRGEAVHAAHRSHVYQRLSRRWSAHSRVTGTYALLNALLVAPLAWASWTNPEAAPWVVLTVMASLVASALRLGAGKP